MRRAWSALVARSRDRLETARARAGWIVLPISRAASLAAAIVVWIKAYHRWQPLYESALAHSTIGYDLNVTWQAERAFLANHPPYAVSGFVYPPSHLLVMLPLAGFSEATVDHYAELALVLALLGIVAISAALVHRRPWGLTAACAFFLLPTFEPVGDEVVLENVSVLIALGFAIALLCMSYRRWIPAAAVLGVMLSVKPLLVPVLLVFVFGRRWIELIVGVAVPIVLNAIAWIVVPGVGSFWSVLPFLLDRTGAAYDAYNAALPSVAALEGITGPVVPLLRVVAAIVALAIAWAAWKTIADEPIRAVTSASVLMVGLFLAGSLTEDHYLFTLLPLGVGVASWRSPMRFPTAWIGVAWIMAVPNLWGVSTLLPSPSTLGVAGGPAQQVARCCGLAMILLSVGATVAFDHLRSGRRARTVAPGPGPAERTAHDADR